MNKDEQLDNDAKKRLEDANQVKILQIVKNLKLSPRIFPDNFIF